jgi:predicted phosphodiesterase
MKIGSLSDTHEDKIKALPHIIREFGKQGVEIIVHCGDILSKHVKPELFGNLPVFCALTNEQTRICEAQRDATFSNNIPFCSPPDKWKFTHPQKRVIGLQTGKDKDNRIVVAYVGHKRSFELLMGSEAKLQETLNQIKHDYDNVRYVFSGHTHHQICLKDGLITFINPGAIERPMGIASGCGYAIIDTEKDEIIYSRIPMSKSSAPPLKVAIISDSINISQKDPNFWGKLANTFKEKSVTDIIHCGNINLEDIGLPELSQFNVHYKLIENQERIEEPDKWQEIKGKTISINGYEFFIQWDLSSELIHKSEHDINCLALQIQKKHPKIKFILSGFTHTAVYEEDPNVIFLNPGDIIQGRNYAIIEMPNYEITLGKIPYDPFPSP